MTQFGLVGKEGMPMMNNNEDDEWMKGFLMGVEEVKNLAYKDDPEANSSGLKLNAIFTTTQG